MIDWIYPLGFLGFLALAVLVLIYIIKPNYQKRFVSSTYVWELSLKYVKKRVPISRLRNLLIFICQILILSTCAFMLAKPIIAAANRTETTEKIIIIDASVSMRAMKDDVTRFERAVNQVKALGRSIISDEGKVSVILAGQEATVVSAHDTIEVFSLSMDKLLEKDLYDMPVACTLGEADFVAAMSVCEGMLIENPAAEVILFTDKDYDTVGDVKVENVSESEWNVAILSCTPVLSDTAFYVFEVEVANYNAERAMDIGVTISLEGVGEDDASVTYSGTAFCRNNEVFVLKFERDVSSYKSAHVQLQLDQPDSFSYDNEIRVYGGKKDVIRIQYVSTAPGPFIRASLIGIQDRLRDSWDIDYKEVRDTEFEPGTADYYVFENFVPQVMPTDGVVILSNPLAAPENLGMSFGDLVGDGSESMAFAREGSHPITEFAYVGELNVTQYRRITMFPEDYTPLMSCQGFPTLLVKNTADSKVAVMPFSINYATTALAISLPAMMYNMFNYFMPVTIDEYVHDINSTVFVNARVAPLTVTPPNSMSEPAINDLPKGIVVTKLGTYTLSQRLLNGDVIVDNFFVKISAAESDFFNKEEELVNPSYPPKEDALDWDILVYFAAALVSFLFIERLLHIREQL